MYAFGLNTPESFCRRKGFVPGDPQGGKIGSGAAAGKASKHGLCILYMTVIKIFIFLKNQPVNFSQYLFFHNRNHFGGFQFNHILI